MDNFPKIDEFKGWVEKWMARWKVPKRFIAKIDNPRSRYRILPEGPNEVRVEYPVPPPGIGTNDETFSLRGNVEIGSKKAAALIVRIAKRHKHI